MSDKRVYRVFVSYGAADRAEGDRLCAWLDRFRAPKGIGAAIERLRPLFRSRAPMAGAMDLSLDLKEALRASERLLVLCSDAAREDRRIDEEIRTFRAYHADAPIVAAILSGDGAPPPALGSEIKRIDLRDGAIEGRLALAAALTGVEHQELLSRRQAQAQRKKRVGLAVALLVLLGAAGLVAWSLYGAIA